MTRPAPFLVSFLFAALAGLGFLGTAQAAAEGGEVTVRAAGDSLESVTVRLAELGGPDVTDRSYRLGAGTRQITGYSIEKVLREAADRSEAIDLDRIPYVEVDRVGAGSPIRLSAKEIGDPDAFADGPPVFFEEDGATIFVKPGKGSGPGSSVRFTNAPIGVTIGVDDDLSVALKASPAKVDAGEPVSLRAVVRDKPEGKGLEFRWDFGDGRSRTGSKASVSHTWPRKGSYPVIVTVTAENGSSGQGAGTIEVGGATAKKPEKDPGGGTGGGGTGDTGIGPGRGGTYGGGYGSGLGGDYGIPGGSDFGVPGSAGPIAPVSPPVGSIPAPQIDPPQPVAPDDGLTPVTGELVAGTAPAPVSTIPPPAGGDTVLDPVKPVSDPAGIPGAVWMLAGAAFLLGLGGLSEVRSFSRFQR